MAEAVIVDAVRTPIGRAFKGSLAQLRPDEMGAFIVDALLERNPEVDPELVEEVYCGVGLPQGLQGFNMGRIIALRSERLPLGTNGATVSRYCASSLETIRQAANAVVASQGDAYIAAGVEWVSRYNEAVEGARPQDQNEHLQGKNGDPDAYISMGLTAENVAERYEVSRADMDKYAQRSQEQAVASQENGYFDREIVPVTLPDGTVVAKDDGPRASSTLEKLSQLDPAFKEDGKVTAGNSCPLNDGAAAVLVMSADKANELGLRPRAKVITSATAAIEPEYMGVAPIGAIQKVLERAGMTIDDVDTVELNEAFAAQVIPIMDQCKIPPGEAQPSRRRDRSRPPVRHDRRADHDHAAQRPRDRRPDDRPRDHVRGRRPGSGDDRGAAQLTALRSSAGDRRRHEAPDQPGQALGLVLRAERQRVLDPLEPRVGQQRGEPLGVLGREEVVLLRPGDQHRPLEGAQPLRRLERVAGVEPAQQAHHVPPHPGVGQHRKHVAVLGVGLDRPLGQPAVGDRQPARRPQPQRREAARGDHRGARRREDDPEEARREVVEGVARGEHQPRRCAPGRWWRRSA